MAHTHQLHYKIRQRASQHLGFPNRFVSDYHYNGIDCSIIGNSSTHWLCIHMAWSSLQKLRVQQLSPRYGVPDSLKIQHSGLDCPMVLQNTCMTIFLHDILFFRLSPHLGNHLITNSCGRWLWAATCAVPHPPSVKRLPRFFRLLFHLCQPHNGRNHEDARSFQKGRSRGY